MNCYVFLKVFADINLFFACIGALPALFPYRFCFLWPSVCCAACAGVAAFLSDHGKSNGRFPFVLLSCLPLLLGNGILEILILLPPVVYTTAMIVKDQWDMEYFHFRDGFRRTLIILSISVVLVHFGVLIENRSDRTHVLSSIGMLQHVLIYGICGIILQRKLRLGREDTGNAYLNALQLSLLAVGTGTIVLAIVLAEWFLSSRGISLGQLIGQAVRYLLSIPLAMMNYLFILLSEMQTARMDQFIEQHYSDTDAVPKMPMEEMQQLLPQTSEEPAAFPWWLAVLLLAAFTCILILLLRSLGKRTAESELTEKYQQITPGRKETHLPRRSNRSKLRKIYREFLKAEIKKGHKLQPFHTSLDILTDLKPESNPRAAEKLRSIYLSARYDLNSPVTPEQVQEAREALKQYKND